MAEVKYSLHFTVELVGRGVSAAMIWQSVPKLGGGRDCGRECQNVRYQLCAEVTDIRAHLRPYTVKSPPRSAKMRHGLLSGAIQY